MFYTKPLKALKHAYFYNQGFGGYFSYFIVALVCVPSAETAILKTEILQVGPHQAVVIKTE